MRDSDAYGYGRGNSYGYTDSDTYPDVNADSYSCSYGYSDSDGDSDGYFCWHSNGNPYVRAWHARAVDGSSPGAGQLGSLCLCPGGQHLLRDIGCFQWRGGQHDLQVRRDNKYLGHTGSYTVG